jgi:hypothetical protein
LTIRLARISRWISDRYVADESNTTPFAHQDVYASYLEEFENVTDIPILSTAIIGTTPCLSRLLVTYS